MTAALKEIAAQIQHWLDYQEKNYPNVNDDTALMSPPVWPTRGVLKNWIVALTAQPEAEPVAWQYRRQTEEGWGMWRHCDPRDVQVILNGGQSQVRPLYTAPPVAAGMLRAAEMLQKKADELTHEHCTQDMETGAWEGGSVEIRAQVEILDDMQDAIRAESSQPEGVVVPVEPIMGQWDDFCKESGVSVPFEAFIRGYKAMLRAAQEGK